MDDSKSIVQKVLKIERRLEKVEKLTARIIDILEIYTANIAKGVINESKNGEIFSKDEKNPKEKIG